MDCRVAIAQTNPRLGDLQANLADHLDKIERAAREGAELVVFPELSLTGYFLRDQVLDVALTLEAPPMARLVEASRRVSIVVGFAERSSSGRIYNSLAFLEDGRVLGVHRKVHLVSYGIFDEARDFAAGERFEIVPSRLGRFGLLICEDVWHTPSAYVHFLNDADALIVSSASPARGVEAPGPGLASQRTWDVLLSSISLLYRTWVVYASRVGWEDGIGFGGASAVLDPRGNRVARIDGFEPGLATARLDGADAARARFETPLRRDEKPWVLAAELARLLPDLRSLTEESREREESLRR
jgi:NAD+ synthase (glutamine-hydrolysing)